MISPNFELKYGLSADEIKLRLTKIIRYSEPTKNQQTLLFGLKGSLVDIVIKNY